MTEERMICEKSHREINHPEHGEITEIWWCPVEPAPPKDWAQQMKDLEERNIRLSRFIMDWLGRELEKAPSKSWRPICYDSQYNKLNGCDPLVITNSCAICPFLASRHKTKVTQKSGGLDINLDINRHKTDR